MKAMDGVRVRYLRAISGRVRTLIWSTMLVSAGMIGCTSPEGRELQRHASPDKVVDAVVVEPRSHATTPVSTVIYLVQAGGDWKAGLGKGEVPVFNADHIEGLRVVWERPRVLAIHYQKGYIRHFANVWHSIDVQEFKYKVEIRLEPDGETALPN